jgi:hypothetical protein
MLWLRLINKMAYEIDNLRKLYWANVGRKTRVANGYFHVDPSNFDFILSCFQKKVFAAVALGCQARMASCHRS